MPLVRIVSNQATPTATEPEGLLLAVSGCVARLLGKPERWVMTCLDGGAKMTFSGTKEPTCYVEVKNIGTISPSVARQISAELCGLVTQYLKVPSNRTYIEFTDVVGQLWGYDGSTFG